MTKEKAVWLQEQMNKMMENDDFNQRLTSAETDEQVWTLLNDHGIDVSIEEVKELGTVGDEFSKSFVDAETGELSDEALEMVAGGSGARYLYNVAKKTWNYGTKIAGLYWGSQDNAKRATVSFWGNVFTRGWNYACDHVKNY